MENIIRNVIRLGIISFYPLCIILLFFILYKREEIKNIIKEKYKIILLNTLIISIISITVLIIYFIKEDMIYSYDYAGHWVRALEMRDLFFRDPNAILPKLYYSMNYTDYSYLPSIILLPITIINTSYAFFSIGNFIMFIIPSIILLQIIYFKYFNKYHFLPIFIYIIFYPLYFGLFFGEVDCVGLFFIIYSIYILFLNPIKDIKLSEYLSINLTSFLLIFLRRYYLFYIAIMYVLFLIKCLIYIYKTKDYKILLYALFSGIIALGIILLFFRPYMLNVINNNFSEAYAVYDRNNKLSALLNYFSYLIIFVVIIAIIKLIKNKSVNIYYLLSMIILICIMFWKTQAFEYHHYNLIVIPMLMIFSYGLYYLLNTKYYLTFLLTILLIFQSSNIFLNIIPNSFPILTKVRKTPEVFWGTKEFKELSSYLNTLTMGDGQSIFMATGSSIFNYDLLQNANLPDISSRPKFEAKTFDLRDGLPRDLQFIRYVIISDPIQYIDKNYQHMYDVVTNAILNEPIVSKIYQPIHEVKISDINITVYEKTGEFTPAIKKYFYDEMLKYYPNKEDFFSYILD